MIRPRRSAAHARSMSARRSVPFADRHEGCRSRAARGMRPGNGGTATSEGADVLRLRPLLALRDVELHALTLVEGLVALRLDRRVVDEDVSAAVGRRDEAEALLAVEPLHGPLS